MPGTRCDDGPKFWASSSRRISVPTSLSSSGFKLLARENTEDMFC